MKTKRLLVAEGVGTRTLMQVAAMAGYRNTSSVYNRMNRGEPIAGHFWSYYDEKDRDLSDKTAAPTVVRLKPKIVCTCPKCKGRQWLPGQIHHEFPQIEGMRIWSPTFNRINEATGHQFGYEAKQTGPSAWRKAKRENCRQRVEDRSRQAEPAGCASMVMPINPHFFGSR